MALHPMHPDARAETVREQILQAQPASRNGAFSAFLQQHGTACSVSESQFGAHLRAYGREGDLWSIRCSEGESFAIFIGSDAKATSWYMPCAHVDRMSNAKCFAPLASEIILR